MTSTAARVSRLPAWAVVAPSLSGRLFARGLDVFPVIALVVTTLNSRGELSFIASPVTKSAGCALALLAAVALLVYFEARSPVVSVPVIIAALAGVLLVTSLSREVPTERLLLLGQYLAITICLLVWMVIRPQRVLGLLFTTGLVHLVLARVFPTEVPWINGAVRLGGGSHPIQLGFEASFVLVVSLVAAIAALRYRWRVLFGAIAVYAAYILVQAFARESLIAASVALVLIMVVVPGPFHGLRLFLAVLLLVGILVLLGPDGIAALLGEDKASDLTSATGRTEIWARILTYVPQFVPFGFGYYSLNDANGPDHDVYFASGGAPAENTLLQVLLDGGIPGTVLWVVYFGLAIWSIVRAREPSRLVGFATLPLFLANVSVSSSLSGTGITWWFLFAVVCETVWSRARSDLLRSSITLPRAARVVGSSRAVQVTVKERRVRTR